MIPISLSWDSQKRSILLKWNGFFSSGLKGGKVFIKIFGIPIPFCSKQMNPQYVLSKGKKIRFPIRWVYLEGIFSFLKDWKLKKVEGSFSFQDPMVNGVLYGWMSAMEAMHADRRVNVTVNFLGKNWCRGETVLSLKALFHHLKQWILLLFREIWGRMPRKGGGSRWKQPI